MMTPLPVRRAWAGACACPLCAGKDLRLLVSAFFSQTSRKS